MASWVQKPFDLYNSPCTFYRLEPRGALLLYKNILSNISSLSVVFYLQQTPKGTPPPSPSQKVQAVVMPDLEQDEGLKADLDLCTGPKDAYVVEVKLLIPFSSKFF